MSERVVITGTGALSALGVGADALWDGLLAGRQGIAPVARLAGLGLRVTWGGDVPLDAPHGRRDLVMARTAIDAALAGAGLADPARLALFWSCGLDTFSLGDAPQHHRAGACFQLLARAFGRPRRMLAVACASGTQTLGEAFRAVREGAIEAAVAGGSSAMLTPIYATGFAALGALATDPGEPARACRPFDATRAGFALADGAGALVVEGLAHARARGARPLAEILGFGTSQDAFDLNRPPDDGAGAALCMRRALADARLEPGNVDAINAHGTGTVAGDRAEAAAITTVFGTRVPVHGCKGAIGHAMAAAGALEAIVAVRTAATGIVPATVNLREPDPACALDHVIGAPRHTDARTVLSCSFGMGGQNAAIILRRPTRRP